MKVKKIINIVILLLLAYFFIPDIMVLLRTNRLPFVPINIIGRQYLMMILMGLFIVYYPKVFISKPMRYVYLYYIVFFLFRISGYYDTENQWFDKYHFTIFLSVLLYTYYHERKDYKGLSFIANGILYMILVAGLLNFFQLIRHPESARAYGYSEVTRYFGIAGYDFPSTLPFFIPILFWFYKYGNLSQAKKIMILLGIIILFFSIILSSITAPIIIASLGIIFAISGVKRLKTSLIFSSFLIILFLVIPTYFYSNILYSTADIIGNPSAKVRLYDVGYGLEHGVDMYDPKNAVDFRASRIPLNFNQFAQYPIFGKGVEGNAHLFWLNYLAQFGLVGTLSLILILNNQFKNNMKLFSENFKFYYLLSVFLFVFSGFVKAYSTLFFFMIIFVVPSMYYLPIMQSKKSYLEFNQNKKV